MRSMGKLAVKGEIITCLNGHPMFMVLDDLFPGDIIRSGFFKGLNGLSNPVEGERLDNYKCSVCKQYSFNHAHLFVNGEPRGGGIYSPWEALKPGTVTLPAYIEGVAKGTMKRINGIVHKRIDK